MITRVPPGTWETLSFPSSTAAGDTAYQLPIDPRLRVRGGGANHGRNDGIAKRRKRSTAKWAVGSRSVSSYRRARGTIRRDPGEGRGDASYEPLEGNMIGTPRPATVFTKRRRIAELARNGPEMAFTTLANHLQAMLSCHRTRVIPQHRERDERDDR